MNKKNVVIIGKQLGRILHSVVFLFGLVWISSFAIDAFPWLGRSIVRYVTIAISVWYLWRCFYRPFHKAPKQDWSRMNFPRRNIRSSKIHGHQDLSDSTGLENN